MQPTIRQILLNRYQATNRQGQTQNFDSHPEAVTFSETGTMIEYKGFEIHPVTFEIFRNNKAIPGSYWRNNVSVEAAKITIDAYLMEASLPPAPVVRAVLAYDEQEAAKELEELQQERWVEGQAANELQSHEK